MQVMKKRGEKKKRSPRPTLFHKRLAPITIPSSSNAWRSSCSSRKPFPFTARPPPQALPPPSPTPASPRSPVRRSRGQYEAIPPSTGTKNASFPLTPSLLSPPRRLTDPREGECLAGTGTTRSSAIDSHASRSTPGPYPASPSKWNDGCRTLDKEGRHRDCTGRFGGGGTQLLLALVT